MPRPAPKSQAGQSLRSMGLGRLEPEAASAAGDD